MYQRIVYCVALAALLCVALGLGSACNKDETKTATAPKTEDKETVRSFTFDYQVTVFAPPKGAGPIELFVPLAQSDTDQRILSRTVVASIKGIEAVEPKYGNRFWHGHLDRSDGKPITVRVTYEVERSVFKRKPAPTTPTAYTDAQKHALAAFLGANQKVPVAGELVDRIRKDLPKHDGTALGKARAIYDYVIANMEYKKTGAGWGNGDTYWACSKRYGNCTDFHALFISLARAEGIPARFEIGFPVPESRPKGKIGGYHCWVEFHIAGMGWIPIDASEAWKHPDKKDLLFGTQPADRIQFTVGRDLKLGAGHASPPLNYFVYPHLEIGKKKSRSYKVEFSYANLSAKDRKLRPPAN